MVEQVGGLRVVEADGDDEPPLLELGSLILCLSLSFRPWKFCAKRSL